MRVKMNVLGVEFEAEAVRDDDKLTITFDDSISNRLMERIFYLAKYSHGHPLICIHCYSVISATIFSTNTLLTIYFWRTGPEINISGWRNEENNNEHFSVKILEEVAS